MIEDEQMIEDIQAWFENRDQVESADCQLVYFPAGYNERSPCTMGIFSVKLKDGTDWHDMPERTGGDYRKDASLLFACARASFERMFSE